MVTRAQVEKLDSRISALAAKLSPEPSRRVEYDVGLVWLQDDGSFVDDAGRPVPSFEPGVVMLSFDPQW